MRCIICDASDQGLSSFRADGRVYTTKFYTIQRTGFEAEICDECYQESEFVLDEFNDDDLENEEGDDPYDFTE